jgi:hypothetical protein
VAVRRRYSDEERANALAALAANGGNVNQTARQLNIPEPTVRHWANGNVHPDVVKDHEEKKESMAVALDRVAQQLLDAIPGKIDKANLSHTATAMGIAIDKARLLRGEPTSISKEMDDLPEDEIDRRIATTEAALADVKARQARQASAS